MVSEHDKTLKEMQAKLHQLQESFEQAVSAPQKTVETGKLGFVLFRLGREIYAWPTDNLLEIVSNHRIYPLPGRRSELYGAINYRNAVMSVTNLHHLLNQPSIEVEAGNLLLVTKGLSVNTALLVDELEGVLSVAEKAISPKPISLDSATSKLIAGEFFRDKQMVTSLVPEAIRG
jgi:chemotaxis signal transduction protein